MCQGSGASAERTCSQSLMESGFCATPCARTALAMSGGCSREASSQMSSLRGHCSHPVFSSSRACPSLPACAARQKGLWI